MTFKETFKMGFVGGLGLFTAVVTASLVLSGLFGALRLIVRLAVGV